MCQGLRAIQQSIMTYAGQFDARTLTGGQSMYVGADRIHEPDDLVSWDPWVLNPGEGSLFGQ